VITHVRADHDLTLPFVLRWLIGVAAACVVRSLLAGWRRRATHPAVVATVGRVPCAAATTITLADVAALPVVAA